VIVCGSEKSRFVGDHEYADLEMTELLQMLKVAITGIHSHIDSQVLGEVRNRFVNVFLWQHFYVVCRATFSSYAVSGFGWSLWYFSSMALQTWVQI